MLLCQRMAIENGLHIASLPAPLQLLSSYEDRPPSPLASCKLFAMYSTRTNYVTLFLPLTGTPISGAPGEGRQRRAEQVP